MNIRWIGVMAVVVGCTAPVTEPEPFEGDAPGECADGADNDRDGDFDCDDADCEGSTDCSTDDPAPGDADTDSDPRDTDADADPEDSDPEDSDTDTTDSDATDSDDTDATDSDDTDTVDSDAEPVPTASCAFALTIDGQDVGADLCSDARMSVDAHSDSYAVLDLAAVGSDAADAGCRLDVLLDDLCGTGTYLVGAGVSPSWNFSSCAPQVGAATGGDLVVSGVSVSVEDGDPSLGWVTLDASGTFTTASDHVLAVELNLVREVTLPFASDHADGCASEVLEETFVEVRDQVSPLDVLFVVDNSCSMSEEQAHLAADWPQIEAALAEASADWHIGVISTDTVAPGAGHLETPPGSAVPFLTDAAATPGTDFASMVTLGINGSIDERGRRAAHMALTDPQLSNENTGFYREDADLAVVIMSDEDDASGSQPTRNEFINFLQGLKADPDMVNFHALVGPVGGCATSDTGTEYLAVQQAVGGGHVSICDSDWNPLWDALGPQPLDVQLMRTPLAGTLEVFASDGATEIPLQQPVDWENSGSTLTLHSPRDLPAPDVVVRYVQAR